MSDPDLPTLIETGPASRELSDRVLIACGCVPEHHILPKHTKWRLPSGARFVTPPDPLKDLNVIAALERECGAQMSAWSADSRASAEAIICTAPTDAGPEETAQGMCWGESQASGDYAEARSRCAALLRSLQAAGRTPVDAP